MLQAAQASGVPYIEFALGYFKEGEDVVNDGDVEPVIKLCLRPLQTSPLVPPPEDDS